MATKANATLSMKLLVDAKAHRVLFAEASKDVVDFLFSLLALPVGTAVKLLGKDAMVGCVGNLYGSVENLDGTYAQSGAAKDALLRPVVSSAVSAGASVFCLPESSSVQPKGFFKCGSCSYGIRNYLTDTRGTECPDCGCLMSTAVQFVPGSQAVQFVPGSQAVQPATSGSAKGFVQGIVTYTVMDDLKVTPMSSISSIALLNTFAVKDLSVLQEKTVQLGYNEGLAILKASLQSRTVLTDVFLGLGKKPTTGGGRA